MKTVQQPWVELGYKVFAYEGPQGLKVERLAKSIGKNKSSFYHHFADLEVFTEFLLQYHLKQTQEIAVEEANCATLEDLIAVLVKYKVDLLFSRQLRIHRENPAFEQCFEQTNKIAVPAILGVWSEIIELKENSYLAGLVLQLSLENFYLQITDETLSEPWLSNYFQELKTLVREFKKNNSTMTIDGGV
ncbi:MAG: TetR/AcrR family transcriptional regulator [Bacteroidota bacterium]